MPSFSTQNYQDEFVDWLVNTELGKSFELHTEIIKGCHNRPECLKQYFKSLTIGYETSIDKIYKFYDELLTSNSELFIEHYNIASKYFTNSAFDGILLGIQGLSYKRKANYFSEHRNVKNRILAVYADEPDLLPNTYRVIYVKNNAMAANAINILKHIGIRGTSNNTIFGNTEVINYLFPDELIIPNRCNNDYIRVVIDRNPEMLKQMKGLVSIKMALYIYDNNILPEEYSLGFMEQEIFFCKNRGTQEPCDIWRAISILRKHGKNVPNYYKL